MPATTPKGYPYPVGSDLVMEGDDAIQALAETIDRRLPAAMWAANVTVPNATGTKAVSVTFPSGLFEVAPIVVIGPRTSAPQNRSMWGAIGVTTSGFQAYTYYGGDATDLGGAWVAVQPAGAVAMMAARTTAAAAEAMITVTCPTPGCWNEGVPITLPGTWTDEDGNVHQVDSVQCGVCGADITDTMTPAGEA